jgi:hypothetical protein
MMADNNVPRTVKPTTGVPSTAKSAVSVPSTQKPKSEQVPARDVLVQHNGRLAEVGTVNKRPYSGQALGVQRPDGVVDPIVSEASIQLATVINSDGRGRRILDRAPWTGFPIVEI